MNDEKIAEALRHISMLLQRQECRIKVLEELAIAAGATQAELRERYEWLWLEQKVRSEDLIGPAGAVQLYRDADDPA